MTSPSKHEKISADLRERILSGEWPEGTIIPSEVDLAESYGVSRPTIRHAFEPLVAEGLVERRRKRGTMVCRAKVARSLDIDPLSIDGVLPTGVTTRVEVISTHILPADGIVARSLAVEPGSRVLRVVRRSLVSEVPNVLTETYIPDGLAAAFSGADLTRVSVLDLLAREGHAPVRAARRLEVIAANGHMATQLAVDDDSPVFWLRSTAYDADDVCVAYNVAAYRGETNAFEFEVSA